MPICLETDRLHLRRFTLDDAVSLLALDSDPEVMRYIGVPPLPSIDAYVDLIRNRILPYYERFPSYGFWVLKRKGESEFLGWFHLRPALDYRFAAEVGYQAGDVDLGYRLVRAAWGQGYATEIACALVARALTQLDAERVVSCALETNLASIRVMVKAGLTQQRHVSFPGYETPGVVYSRSRDMSTD